MLKEIYFTRNERAQYNIILPVAQRQRMTVFAKVRLADLVAPDTDEKNQKGLFYKIQAKHCDFVVCNSMLNVVAVIEIDDRSHERDDRQKRDKFVDFILQDCGIKVLRYTSVNALQLESDLKSLNTFVPVSPR